MHLLPCLSTKVGASEHCSMVRLPVGWMLLTGNTVEQLVIPPHPPGCPCCSSWAAGWELETAACCDSILLTKVHEQGSSSVHLRSLHSPM